MTLRRPCIALVQLSVGIAIFWTNAAQCAQPLAAIDWLTDPPTGERHQALQHSDRSTSHANSALPVPVRTGGLSGYNINAAGLITAQTAQLPSDLWPPTQITQAAELLPRIPRLKSKEANLLLAALLMAENDTARMSDTVPLFMARIEKLVDLGALEAATTLVSLASAYEDSRLIRLALDIALIRGPAKQECARAITSNILVDEQDRLAEIYCEAMAQNWQQAEFLLITSEALGLLSEIDLELMWQFVDPAYADTTRAPTVQIDQLSPIRFQLIEGLGATPFLNEAPTPYQWSYLNGRTGWKLQIEAAEKLARASVVSGNALLEYYTARKPSASGGVWDRAAAVQRLDTATPPNRSTAFYEAYEVFNRTGDILLLAEIVYALDLGRDNNIANDPLWTELMILAHPQMVEADRVAHPLPRISFAMALLSHDHEAAHALQGTDPLVSAVWHAMSVPVTAQAPTGPKIAQALIELAKGENGDMYAVNKSLRHLRAMGLARYAARIAAQLTIMGPQ